ncbi:GGDEF domain-containing protein [Vagococcus coleopterorum]|uniref:GGDEF domain-containing protein n=1 Tax=Vagococcus coleopterorum TaxID=2714946 RepID=A0A6G8AMW8_9ENTE|nr:GGDEF domain-containing protein [Vagococcus coleopterorum]QIL46347.1 GGDEF domain-containing protein [Vagococcus coleopterorum]
MLINHLPTFFNTYVINLSLILSSVLTYYFLSLAKSFKRAEYRRFAPQLNVQNIFDWKETLVSSFALAVATILLAYNTIPSYSKDYSLDTSYILIYLTIMFGTPLLGIFTTISFEALSTFILTKQQVDLDPAIARQYFLFVIIIVSASYGLRFWKISLFKKHVIFLTLFIILKSFFFSIYTDTFGQSSQVIDFVYQTLVYGSLFTTATLIITKIISVTKSFDSVHVAANTDGLTQAFNRFAFDQEMNRLEAIPADSQQNFCLSVIDIDNFKLINDTHGHQAGDQALIYLATLLATTGENDEINIYRTGGDEFTLLHQTNTEKARSFYNNLFHSLEQQPFEYNHKNNTLLISVGLTEVSKATTFNSTACIVKADHALYQSKEVSGNHLTFIK